MCVCRYTKHKKNLSFWVNHSRVSSITQIKWMRKHQRKTYRNMLVWTFSFSSYVPYNMYFTFCFLSYANRLPIERRTHASCQPDWDISDFLLHTKTNFQECCWDSYLRWSLWLIGKNVECVVALGWISPITRLEITDYDCAMMMQILVNVPRSSINVVIVTRAQLFSDQVFVIILLFTAIITLPRQTIKARAARRHSVFICITFLCIFPSPEWVNNN